MLQINTANKTSDDNYLPWKGTSENNIELQHK